MSDELRLAEIKLHLAYMTPTTDDMVWVLGRLQMAKAENERLRVWAKLWKSTAKYWRAKGIALHGVVYGVKGIDNGLLDDNARYSASLRRARWAHEQRRRHMRYWMECAMELGWNEPILADAIEEGAENETV